MRPGALAFALAVALPLVAGAADEEPPIQPDRAGAAGSAGTNRPGQVQLELGVQYARERSAGTASERRSGVEAALMVGLTERLELGLEGEPVVRLRGAARETDVGDVSVNLKYRVFDPPESSWLPTLAVQTFVKLPLAQPPIGSGETDVGALALASFELPWEVGLDFNAGLAVLGQRAGWRMQALLALGVSRPVGNSLAVFTDLFYASREERGGRDGLGMDAGIIWWPTRDVALDASVVTSLAGAGPDWVVRAGVSVRFGR